MTDFVDALAQQAADAAARLPPRPRKAKDPPCEVAILGGYDKGKRSWTIYCDCGRTHTMRQVRLWQQAAAQHKKEAKP